MCRSYIKFSVLKPLGGDKIACAQKRNLYQDERLSRARR